jgi:hypothetical protein
VVASFDKLVTRRLPSVAPTRWLHTKRLAEVVSQPETEIIKFFKSKKGGTVKRIFLLENIVIFFKIFTSIFI